MSYKTIKMYLLPDEFAVSYTGGGGGGHKVPALISRIRIFATNTVIATKFGDFS